jgi:hypothetical protein
MEAAATTRGEATAGDPSATARGTAVVIGALILTATTSYLIGSALIESSIEAPYDFAGLSETRIRFGVFLEFINAATVVGVGVLLFPVLRRYREGMALGYAATRVLESALLLVSALFVLSFLSLADADAGAGDAGASQLVAWSMEGYDLAFQLAMIVLGAGSLLLAFVLYEARLVPRFLPILAFVGYVALFASGWLEIAGHSATWLYVPGGLFELIFPLWLIVRGFTPPPAESQRHVRAANQVDAQ